MLGLPDRFVLFDTEFTAWEGSMERAWSGPNEYCEIIQIGALKVRGTDLSAEESAFSVYVKPLRNPILSEYITALTGITQEKINREGVSFEKALADFDVWTEKLALWSHGNDLSIVKENCLFTGTPFPFSGRISGNTEELFRARGISTGAYTSGTILKAFGKEPTRQAHDAVNDMRNLLEALRELAKR